MSLSTSDIEDLKRGTLSKSTSRELIRQGIEALSQEEQQDYKSYSDEDKTRYKDIYITDFIHRWNMDRLVKFHSVYNNRRDDESRESLFFAPPTTKKVSFRSMMRESGKIVTKVYPKGFSTSHKLLVLGKNIKTMRFAMQGISMLYINSPVGKTYYVVGANDNHVYFVISGHFFDRYRSRYCPNVPYSGVVAEFMKRNLFHSHTVSSRGMETSLAFKDGQGLGISLRADKVARVIFLKTFISKSMCGKKQVELNKLQEGLESVVSTRKEEVQRRIANNCKDLDYGGEALQLEAAIDKLRTSSETQVFLES